MEESTLPSHNTKPETGVFHRRSDALWVTEISGHPSGGHHNFQWGGTIKESLIRTFEQKSWEKQFDFFFNSSN